MARGENTVEEEKSLFRRESLDRISSPEKTDNYVRLPNPPAWLPAAALALVVLGSLLCWLGMQI